MFRRPPERVDEVKEVSGQVRMDSAVSIYTHLLILRSHVPQHPLETKVTTVGPGLFVTLGFCGNKVELK